MEALKNLSEGWKRLGTVIGMILALVLNKILKLGIDENLLIELVLLVIALVFADSLRPIGKKHS